MNTLSIDWLQEYRGELVVCDLADHYLIIGMLDQVGPHHLAFIEADLHDHREANSTKDVYLIETRKFGVRANRKQVSIPRPLLIAISRLDDVTLT